MKYCSKCKQTLNVSEFHKHKKYGYQGYCKVCMKASRRKHTPEENRRIDLKRHYGLTPEEYDIKLSAQGGKCAANGCDEIAEYKPGVLFALAVDHNHDTGEVRGLLCSQCNRALGLLKDNPELIQGLLNYRKKYE